MAEYVEMKRREDPQWDFPFKFPQKNPLWTPPPPHQQLQWQAARASGAAPTYFRYRGNTHVVITGTNRLNRSIVNNLHRLGVFVHDVKHKFDQIKKKIT
jgi:hypothetical protein